MIADTDQLRELLKVAVLMEALAREYEKMLTPWQRAALRTFNMGAEAHARQAQRLGAEIDALTGPGPRAA